VTLPLLFAFETVSDSSTTSETPVHQQYIVPKRIQSEAASLFPGMLTPDQSTGSTRGLLLAPLPSWIVTSTRY
jgi:hypothetical protein